MAITNRLRNLFARGATSRKENPTYDLIVNETQLGKPVYTQRNFRTLADVAYGKNIYIYRAITLIAQSAAGISWNLYTTGAKPTQIEDHPLLDVMRAPNPEQGFEELIESLVSFMVLSGNTYLNAVSPSNSKIPQELWILPPHRMTVIPDRTGIVGFQYELDGQKMRFTTDQIMHLKMFAANDDFYGMSPVFVAASLVDQMNEANDWNTALLQNSARPSGALVMQNMLGDEQFRRLRRQIAERYTGKKNAGKPLLLEGGLQWQQFGFSPVELDWLTAKQEGAKEIAVALGVPPEMLGSQQGRTYNNYKEARASFYTETILPLMDRLQGHLNMWLVPKFGQGIELVYDKTDIEALHDDKDVTMNRAKTLFTTSLVSWNEAREIVGMSAQPYGDFVMIPGPPPKFIPLAEMEQYLEAQVKQALQPPAQPGQLPAPSSGDGTGSGPSTGTGGAKYLDRTTIREESLIPSTLRARGGGSETVPSIVSVVEGYREKWEARLLHSWSQYLENEQSSVVAAIKQAALPISTIDRARYALTKQTDGLSTLMGALYLNVTDDFGGVAQHDFQTRLDEQGTHVTVAPFNVWHEDVQGWIATQASAKVAYILSTTTDQITTLLDAGVKSGWSVPQLADAVAAFYTDVMPSRIRTIIDTEVVAASNFGMIEEAKQSQVVLRKRWYSHEDDRTRDAHALAHNQVKSLESFFVVDQESLLFPGDISHGATASNIINCRCLPLFDLIDHPKHVDPVPVRPDYEAKLAQILTLLETVLQVHTPVTPSASTNTVEPSHTAQTHETILTQDHEQEDVVVLLDEHSELDDTSTELSVTELRERLLQATLEKFNPHHGHGGQFVGAGDAVLVVHQDGTRELGPKHPDYQGGKDTPPATVEMHDSIRQQMTKWFGKELSDTEIAGLAGAPSGTVVKANTYGGNGTVNLWVSGNGVKAARTISKKGSHLEIENVSLSVEDSQQGHGIGTKMLLAEAEQASALGISKITTEAAGGKKLNYNGYYTWARLGYDAPFASGARKPEWAPQVKSITELMALPATPDHVSGASWWKENGWTWQGTFDLTKGSKSFQILHAYADARGIAHKEQYMTWMEKASAGNHEEIPWSDEDEAVAERVWNTLAQQWKKDGDTTAHEESNESKSNPNHDGHTGQFASGGGSTSLEEHLSQCRE